MRYAGDMKINRFSIFYGKEIIIELIVLVFIFCFFNHETSSVVVITIARMIVSNV